MPLGPEEPGSSGDPSSMLGSLKGKRCWSVIAGGKTSNVSMDFGDRVLRDKELSNETLREEQRRFEGEFRLFATCSWSVASPTGPITEWSSDDRKAIETLEGGTVAATTLHVGNRSATIALEDGRSVTFDLTEPTGGADEFSFWHGGARLDLDKNGVRIAYEGDA